MSLTRFSRRATAFLAVLVLLFRSVGEAVGHPCPHHGAPGAAHEASGGEHARHDASPRAGHSQPEPEEYASPCTCVGACQVASLSLLLPDAPGVLALETSVPARISTHTGPPGPASPASSSPTDRVPRSAAESPLVLLEPSTERPWRRVRLA